MANPAPEEAKKARVKRPTAQKRHRQDEKRRVANKSVRSCIRTKIKGFREDETLEAAQRTTNLNELNSLLDKAAKKKLFTKNKASRLKSRLAARLRRS
jgi:small subunit ribosomal protein S20